MPEVKITTHWHYLNGYEATKAFCVCCGILLLYCAKKNGEIVEGFSPVGIHECHAKNKDTTGVSRTV